MSKKPTFIEHMKAKGVSEADAKLLAGKCVTNQHIWDFARASVLDDPSITHSIQNGNLITQSVAGFDPNDRRNHRQEFWSSPAQIRTHEGAKPHTMTFEEFYNTVLKDVPTRPDGNLDVSQIYADSLTKEGGTKRPMDIPLFMPSNAIYAKEGKLPACEVAVSDAFGAAPTRVCAADNAAQKEQQRG